MLSLKKFKTWSSWSVFIGISLLGEEKLKLTFGLSAETSVELEGGTSQAWSKGRPALSWLIAALFRGAELGPETRPLTPSPRAVCHEPFIQHIGMVASVPGTVWGAGAQWGPRKTRFLLLKAFAV